MGTVRGLVAAVLVWLCGAPGGQAAEAGKLPFKLLGADQGLPSASVTCLAQDEDGFLWMGTENGLVRYEGEQARRWTLEDGLPSGAVSGLLPAQGGGLWLITNRGLVRFKGGRFERPEFGGGEEDRASVNSASEITRDQAGRVWALSGHRIYVQEEGLRFRPGPRLDGSAVSHLWGGRRSGAVFAAGAGWLKAFLPDGRVRTWDTASGLPTALPTMVVEDGLGRVWVGAARELVMKEADGDDFRDRSSLLPASLSPNALPFVEADGSIWLPTQGGGLHLTGDRTELLDMGKGLPFRWVRSMFRDREGTLWVWGPGLARLLGGGRIRNHSLLHSDAGEMVWCMIRDPKGRLIVGTDDGAAVMAPDGLERIPGTEGHRVKGIALDAAGTLWMVGTTGPALWLRPGEARAVRPDLGPLGTSLNFVTRDSKGRLWLGHARAGLLRWDPTSRRLVQEVGPGFMGVAGLLAMDFREDSLGRLWVATSEGLLVHDQERGWQRFDAKDGLQRKSLLGLALLPDGSAWVHYTEPLGLTRLRLEGGRLKVLEQRVRGSGLRSNMVYAAEVDGLGRTWASTDQGLDRLDPPRHFGRMDGMAGEDCDVHALRIEKDCLWLGTVAGLVQLDLQGREDTPEPPKAHIVEVGYGRQVLVPPLGAPPPLASSDGTLSFRVAAPAYLNEGEHRYQVRLRGLEDGWRLLEGRTARYPALAGNRYVFEVRAAYGDGSYGPVAAFPFTVRPPWWKTWWALTLEVVAGLLAFRAVVRLRVASLARSKAMLESLVGQRTEELAARNEELSAALGRVKVLSGLLPICASCKKIRDDRGYWNQLEHYIIEHSEALFTHGICPDCSQAIYPDFSKRKSDPHQA